jgi:hypothetical protein
MVLVKGERLHLLAAVSQRLARAVARVKRVVEAL